MVKMMWWWSMEVSTVVVKKPMCVLKIGANDSERTSSRCGNEENGMFFLEEAKGREKL
jgi:hypothetical protein